MSRSIGPVRGIRRDSGAGNRRTDTLRTGIEKLAQEHVELRRHVHTYPHTSIDPDTLSSLTFPPFERA